MIEFDYKTFSNILFCELDFKEFFDGSYSYICMLLAGTNQDILFRRVRQIIGIAKKFFFVIRNIASNCNSRWNRTLMSDAIKRARQRANRNITKLR